MILGYATNQKAYKLWNMNKEEVTVSRVVVFDESAAAHNASDDTHAIEIDDKEENYNPNDENASSSSESSYGDEQRNLEENKGEPSTPPRESQLDPDEESHIASDGRRITPSRVAAEARRSARQRRAPSESWKATALSSVAQEDPLTFSAAIQEEDENSWRKAIDTEINAITGNKTWSLVPRTESYNILTSKWVFKCKKDN